MTGEKCVTRLLEVIANDIVPLTRVGVSAGNKVFGAAILHKEDLSLVIAGSNNENENPLWHGEVHTLKLFYEMPAKERPCGPFDNGLCETVRDLSEKQSNIEHPTALTEIASLPRPADRPRVFLGTPSRRLNRTRASRTAP